MKKIPPLTMKGILKRHKKNQKDKSLHNTIETKSIKNDSFNKLIQQSIKHKPFDKNNLKGKN